jgi:hypothetical protein
MNIIITNIPDVNVENLDATKVELANKVVRKFYPIVDKVYHDKQLRFKNLEIQVQKNKVKIIKEKNEIEKLVSAYKRKGKMKTILERISKLVSSGLINETSGKKEMVSVLKSIDNLSDEKLNLYLSETLKILNKRFTKSLTN